MGRVEGLDASSPVPQTDALTVELYPPRIDNMAASEVLPAGRFVEQSETNYFMASADGLEPSTYSLEGCCSIRLSYAD